MKNINKTDRLKKFVSQIDLSNKNIAYFDLSEYVDFDELDWNDYSDADSAYYDLYMELNNKGAFDQNVGDPDAYVFSVGLDNCLKEFFNWTFEPEVVTASLIADIHVKSALRRDFVSRKESIINFFKSLEQYENN